MPNLYLSSPRLSTNSRSLCCSRHVTVQDLQKWGSCTSGARVSTPWRWFWAGFKDNGEVETVIYEGHWGSSSETELWREKQQKNRKKKGQNRRTKSVWCWSVGRGAMWPNRFWHDLVRKPPHVLWGVAWLFLDQMYGVCRPGSIEETRYQTTVEDWFAKKYCVLRWLDLFVLFQVNQWSDMREKGGLSLSTVAMALRLGSTQLNRPFDWDGSFLSHDAHLPARIRFWTLITHVGSE